MQQLFRAAFDLCFGPAKQLWHRCNVLRDCHVREKADLLDHITDMATQLHGINPRDILAVDNDLAFGRIDQPVDHPHGRRLAATGRADQCCRRPLWHNERQIVDRSRTTLGIAFRDMFHRDHAEALSPKKYFSARPRMNSVARASSAIGTAPTRRRDISIMLMPTAMKSPSPPPPMNGASVAPART